MADINLKLTIDGKEAIQTLNLTEAQLKQLKADLDKIKNEKIKTTLETEMKGMPIDKAKAMYAQLKAEFQEKIRANVPLGELDELKAKLGVVGGALSQVESEGEQAGEGLTMGFAKFGLAVQGVQQAIAIVGGLIGKPLEVAGQFEKYAITLKVMLGSAEEAAKRMEEYVNIGATTPFELSEVVELGNGLQALGKYSKENVLLLGDLAAASGKPIAQVAGAYAKLATGQKGVAVDMFRDLLITQQDWEMAIGKSIDKITAQEMEVNLGKVVAGKGFSGMMDEQSKSLEGIKSNFEDTITGLMNDVGQDILPVAKEVFGVLISGISITRDSMEYIRPIIAVMSVAIAGWAVATYGLVGAKVALAGALKLAKLAIDAMNASWKANPTAMIIAGIAGIVAGIVILRNALTQSVEEKLEDVKAQVKLNDEAINATKTLKDQADGEQVLIKEMNKKIDAYKLLKKGSEEEITAQEELRKSLIRMSGTHKELIPVVNDFGKAQGLLNAVFDTNTARAEEYRKKLIELEDIQKKLAYSQKWSEYDVLSKEGLSETQNLGFDSQFSKEVKDAFYVGQTEQERVDKLSKLVEKTKQLKAQLLANATYTETNIDTGLTETKTRDIDVSKYDKLLSKIYEGQLKLKEIEATGNKTVPTTPTTPTTPDKPTGTKKSFADDLKKLEESYSTSQFRMTEIDKASKEDLLKAEKKFIEDKIMLYREYDKDKAPLIVELKTVTTKLDVIEEEKFIKERKESRTKTQDVGLLGNIEKELNPNYKPPLSEEEKNRNKLKPEQTAELDKRKEKFAIDQMDNEFERQRAMVDFEKQAELEKYINYSNYAQMKVQIEAEASAKKEAINEAEKGAQISMAKETLSILATMINEQTALGKGIAIAQATINTYVGATKALDQGGILGAVLMAVVIAQGMAQVANIMAVQPPKMTGYAKGGYALVGEAGTPEIISPIKDYAEGQNALITAVVNRMGGAGENAKMESLFIGFYSRLESWQTNMQFQIKRGDLYSSVKREELVRARSQL